MVFVNDLLSRFPSSMFGLATKRGDDTWHILRPSSFQNVYLLRIMNPERGLQNPYRASILVTLATVILFDIIEELLLNLVFTLTD